MPPRRKQAAGNSTSASAKSLSDKDKQKSGRRDVSVAKATCSTADVTTTKDKNRNISCKKRDVSMGDKDKATKEKKKGHVAAKSAHNIGEASKPTAGECDAATERKPPRPRQTAKTTREMKCRTIRSAIETTRSDQTAETLSATEPTSGRQSAESCGRRKSGRIVPVSSEAGIGGSRAKRRLPNPQKDEAESPPKKFVQSVVDDCYAKDNLGTASTRGTKAVKPRASKKEKNPVQQKNDEKVEIQLEVDLPDVQLDNSNHEQEQAAGRGKGGRKAGVKQQQKTASKMVGKAADIRVAMKEAARSSRSTKAADTTQAANAARPRKEQNKGKEGAEQGKVKAVAKQASRKSLGRTDILSILDSGGTEDDDGEVEDDENEIEKAALLNDTKTRSSPRKIQRYPEKAATPTEPAAQESEAKVSSSRKSKRTLAAAAVKVAPKVSKPTSISSNAKPGNVSLSGRVPVWKSVPNSSLLLPKPEDHTAQGNQLDVFDVLCYGEEEFGPEREVPKPVRKKREKKKETKAIIVFGAQDAGGAVADFIKKSHNLKTPKAVARKPPPAARRKVTDQISSLPQVTVAGCPNMPPTRSLAASTTLLAAPALRPQKMLPPSRRPDRQPLSYSSDFSIGADHYFDSHAEYNPPEVDQAEVPVPEPSAPLLPPPPVYKTPVIPKKMSKLQQDKSSTPLLQKPREPESKQEMIKNAFGFDDTDEESSEEGSMIISPVKKVCRMGATILEISNSNVTNPSFRMSNISSLATLNRTSTTVTDGKKRTDLPFRFEVVPSKSRIMAQVAALQRQRMELALSRHTRTSPRKKRLETEVPTSLPVAAVTEERMTEICEESPVEPADFEDSASTEAEKLTTPAPCAAPVPPTMNKNAFEVLKAASREGPPSASTSSTLPIQPPRPKQKVKRLTKKAAKNNALDQSSVLGDKENLSGQESAEEAVNKKRTYNRPARTRKPSGVTVSDETFTSPTSPKQRVTKQEKKLAEWASNQTNHFSEVEEFDLSFS